MSSATRGVARLLAIPGSLRSASINAAYCRACTQLAPPQLQVEVFAGLGELPLFNPDLESAPPAAVLALRARVAAADALLIASPEYAHGVAGAMKNALDWLVSFEGFVGKPVALVNTSPRSHHAWQTMLETLRTMSAAIIDEASVGIALLGHCATEADMLASPDVRARTQGMLAAIQEYLLRKALEPGAPEDVVLSEQLGYYRARAAEYDQWWLRQGRYDRGTAANAQWFAESRDLVATLERFGPSGEILELACGTGIWSERLLPFARRLTVVDGAAEMLALARHRLQAAPVEYIQADLFAWQPARRYDTVFFSFWLSHVPPERFAAFWELVGRCLTPQGRVFFIDSRHEPTSTATDHVLPEAQATTLRRRLNDGREFRIFKIFHDAQQLERRLAALGWRVSVASTGSYFICGHGGRG